jgi:putative ATP-binding cassette transporter
VIADWRATLFRVAVFRHALTTPDDQQHFDRRITYTDGEPGVRAFEDLEIVSNAGWEMLKERRVVVRAGERVLIVGAPGTGKTQLFRALAGLWPWGSGRITRPREEQILYLPSGTPYLPRGSLREILAYPQKTESFEESAYRRALERLDLPHLFTQLDVTRRWDRELSQHEQQSLAFARIVLHAPEWLLMDDALGSLDDEALERITDVFEHELHRTSVIHIGRAAQAHHPLFSRVLHLVKAPTKPTVVPETPADAQTKKESAIGRT